MWQWLHSQNLIPLLLSFLSSEYAASTQTASGDFIKALITISANASQNEQSCIGPNDLTRQLVSQECIEKLIGDMLKGGNPLTVGVGIIIEVIRKNNSDYDPDIGTGVDSIPSSKDPIYLGTLLRLFASHVPDFMKLVLSHGILVTDQDGVKKETKRELKVAFGGSIEPLGFDRFKTCELMAELLHCSNMGLLNEKGGERYVKERDAERERLKVERRQLMLMAEEMGGLNAGVEGIVVEKPPLHVKNGEAELSDDGINEDDEFEDVLVSGMLDDVRVDSDTDGVDIQVPPTLDPGDRRKKDDDDDDIFTEDPFSPPKAPTNTPVSCAEPPAAPADVAPPNTTQGEPSAADNVVSQVATEPHATTAKSDIGDVSMEEAPPVVPPKDNPDAEAPEAEQPQDDAAIRAAEGCPKAPSPPLVEEDDEALRKGGRSLVEDLKASTQQAAPSTHPPAAITAERLDAALPPLPVEQPSPPPAGQEPEEENLMDLHSTPDTTIAEGDISVRSMASFGSSLTEYQAMIEPDLDGNPVVGDYLKMMFVEHQIVPTILVWPIGSAKSGARIAMLTQLAAGLFLPISMEQFPPQRGVRCGAASLQRTHGPGIQQGTGNRPVRYRSDYRADR